jgi:phage replication initiation protein
MPKREYLSIKIDYLSMVFDSITAEELIKYIIALPFSFFHKRDAFVKYKDYSKVYEFGHIKIYGDRPKTKDNPEGLGCYISTGGKGCDYLTKFFHIHGNGFGSFFMYCDRYLYGQGFHVTRIDIAIDDKNSIPYFTVEQIVKKCQKKEFISICNKCRYIGSDVGDDTIAKTVYIGDGGSDISFRMYDKDKEMCSKYDIPYEEMESWKRTEVQLRNEKAHAFAMLLADKGNHNQLGQLTFNLLSSSLRFVNKDKHQTNQNRWKISAFWKRFIGAVQPLKLEVTIPPTSLLQTQHWLRYGGALSAVKAFVFLEHYNALDNLYSMEDIMYTTTYSPELCNKLVEHVSMIDREELIPLVHQETRSINTHYKQKHNSNESNKEESEVIV